MRFVKWKILIATCLVCLLPILLGLALWDRLPEMMAIHFDMNNNPDNFVPKGVAVVGLPLLMAVLQAVCCIMSDAGIRKRGMNKKLERMTRWMIPIVTVVLYVVTLGYGMGMVTDIRRIAIFIVGAILVVTGHCMSKSDYIKNYDIEPQKARKINGFVGFETVVMGFLGIVTVFFPPIISTIWLFLMIPYGIVGIIYAIKVMREK